MEKLIKMNMISNKEQYIEKYLKYIDVSDNTSKEYAIGIRNFFEYCNVNEINNVQRENIIQYREQLKQEGKKANTINLYLASIKSFFKWLEYEEVYKNITDNIKSVPVAKLHVREAFTIEQLKTILDNCKTLREKIIILLATNCGLRCNEMCNIRISDFQIKQDVVCLYVLGKARQGQKADFVVVDNKTYQLIKEYIEEYSITDYLFTSTSNYKNGNPITTRAMRKIFNKILERCDMKDNLHTFHSMRHSFCNINLENGVSIQEVSMAMRHSNISTTMHYVKDIEAKNNKCFNTINNLIY